ncbi:MAG: hypothetical protein KJ718_03330 [Nanoarchaeota archaeon]|nr:hypothetical protein [Nanoarchaeota archaeon]MBU1051561.1 hypothetical protein [Nanoarchaeota archaeon]
MTDTLTTDANIRETIKDGFTRTLGDWQAVGQTNYPLDVIGRFTHSPGYRELEKMYGEAKANACFIQVLRDLSESHDIVDDHEKRGIILLGNRYHPVD